MKVAFKEISNDNCRIEVQDVRMQLPKHEDLKFQDRDELDIKQVVYHHAAGNLDAFGIAQYHISPNHISNEGCPGICYHWYVDKAGKLFLCNNHDLVVWGVIGQNGNSIHVCFEGNLYDGDPTIYQERTAITLWEWLRDYHGLSAIEIYGHNAFAKKPCPGPLFTSMIKSWKPGLEVYNLKTKKERQEFLRDLGFYKGKIDGIWGSLSKRATYEFQLKYMGKEEADGLFGPRTWMKAIEVLTKKNLL